MAVAPFFVHAENIISAYVEHTLFRLKDANLQKHFFAPGY